MNAIPRTAGGPGAGDEPTTGLWAALFALLAAVAGGLAVVASYAPLGALVALAGLLVVAVCVARVDVALYLLVAAAPLEAAFQIGSSPDLTVTKIVGALCFASFALNALAGRREVRFDGSHALVILLLVLATLSTLQAREIFPALATTLRYASFVALYVVVSQFIGDRAFQRRVVWTLSLASAAAGSLALYNFIWGDALQASLPYTNANDTAFMLATTLPLTFWLLHGRWFLRPVVVVLIGLMSAAVVLSFSRGALVGLGAALVWHVATERRHLLVILAATVVAGLVAFAFVRANPEQVDIGLQGKERVAEENVNVRLDAWRGALELTSEHPLLGVGPGNFRYYFFEVTGRPPGTHNPLLVHNAYLDVATEVGIVGGLLFLAYIGTIFRRASVARRGLLGAPGYATAVRTSFVVAFVAALFLSEQYFAPFWLLGGLATAVWGELRLRAEAPGAEGSGAAPAGAAAYPPLRPVDGARPTGA